MPTQDRIRITTPVGRIVLGSLYTAVTKDAEGKPLIIKNGSNAGQPRINFFFALAIPKGAEAAQGPYGWAYTEWGQQIWAVGNQAFPQMVRNPAFAWKIEDGDSQTPNKKNRKPCDNEGWKDHWILKFSGGTAPSVFVQNDQKKDDFIPVAQEGYIKCGYYVQVRFDVSGNDSSQNPGIYLNHKLVCFRAYGQEIQMGENVQDAGFGAAPLPAGASMVPLTAAMPIQMPPASPAAPVMSPAVPPVPGPAATPIYPNMGFVQMPPPPGAPVAGPGSSPPTHPGPGLPGATIAPVPSSIPLPPNPPAPPAGPQYAMTAKAIGATREQFQTQGWTDAQLLAQGYMTQVG